MRRVKVNLFFVLVLVMVVACATANSTFMQDTYRSLYSAGTSYDFAMTTVRTLQTQGIISSEQRTEIDRIANIFYVAYQSSVTAFETYRKTKEVSDQNKLIVILGTLSSRWKEFASYVNRIKPGSIPDIYEEVK